jgi:hypothetical protein
MVRAECGTGTSRTVIITSSHALLEFFFHASYTSHDVAILDLMENALRWFYETKDVFPRYRAGKRFADSATERRVDLIGQRNADHARRRLARLSSTALQAEQRSWNTIIDAEVVATVEDGTH